MIFYTKAMSFLALVAGASAGIRKKEDRDLMMGNPFNGKTEDKPAGLGLGLGLWTDNSDASSDGQSAPSSLTLTLTNTHAFHHFGLWFIAVHEPGALDIFELNKPASDGLGLLCMRGDPSGLAGEAAGVTGVTHVAAELAVLTTPAFEAIGSGGDGAPSPLGLRLGVGSLEFTVPLASENSVVTMVAMMGNSNDGCVVLDGAKLRPGMTVPMIEIDAGTEGNDEACENIAGCLPGVFGDEAVDIALSVEGNTLCPCPLDSGNMGTPLAGEGFMSYHRGISTLPGNDWRDHMVLVTVS